MSVRASARCAKHLAATTRFRSGLVPAEQTTGSYHTLALSVRAAECYSCHLLQSRRLRRIELVNESHLETQTGSFSRRQAMVGAVAGAIACGSQALLPARLVAASPNWKPSRPN